MAAMTAASSVHLSSVHGQQPRFRCRASPRTLGRTHRRPAMQQCRSAVQAETAESLPERACSAASTSGAGAVTSKLPLWAPLLQCNRQIIDSLLTELGCSVDACPTVLHCRYRHVLSQYDPAAQCASMLRQCCNSQRPTRNTRMYRVHVLCAHVIAQWSQDDHSAVLLQTMQRLQLRAASRCGCATAAGQWQRSRRSPPCCTAMQHWQQPPQSWATTIMQQIRFSVSPLVSM